MTFESHIGGNSEKMEAHLALKMDIQRALIEHATGPDENFEEHGLKWIEENSENFRTLFDEMIKENPNLDREWEENETKVLDKVHEKLFEMQKLKKAA